MKEPLRQLRNLSSAAGISLSSIKDVMKRKGVQLKSSMANMPDMVSSTSMRWDSGSQRFMIALIPQEIIGIFR